MDLVWPAREHLASYIDALQGGWSPNNLRPGGAQEDLAQIETDAERFLATRDFRRNVGEPVVLPDRSRVQRLPGFVLWLWDGAFCGWISLRWQPGTTALPPHVLGHIGYGVVPSKRGRGYATDALRQMLEYARVEGLPFVDLTTDPDNLASQRVIEKNGGVLVEHFTKVAAYGGGPSIRWRIVL
jgi:predicted acetyltransferase